MRQTLHRFLFVAACWSVVPMGCSATQHAPTQDHAALGSGMFDLWGRELHAGEESAEALANLAQAEQNLASHPDQVEAWIWVGRRLAYLGRIPQAIEVYSLALERFPEEARLYRHRGHRWISMRRFDAAIADLERAAELMLTAPDAIEPDGLPNAAGIPLSTLYTNVYYHLGLAHFLKGQWGAALKAYERCRAAGSNDDNWVSATHWLFLLHHRLGQTAEAQAVLNEVNADMRIIENMGYHRLCLFYRGELSAAECLADVDGAPASDAVRYGVASWHFNQGSPDEAIEQWQALVREGQWNSFGSIAAEADLKRLGLSPTAPRKP